MSPVNPATATGRPPVLVLVNGPPCAGKSHLTDVLAESTSLPIMTKDMIKETVYDAAGWADRDWSRRLGTAASALLWMFARSLLSQGQDCLIEANFRASLAANELARLTSDLKFTSAQIFVTAAPSVLAERFRTRASLQTRHPGHLDAELQHEYSEGSIPAGSTAAGTRNQLRVDVEHNRYQSRTPCRPRWDGAHWLKQIRTI